MFKRSAGVEYRENRVCIFDKTRGEKRREPVPERSLQVRIERTGCRGLVGLLVRAEYLPYGVSGLTALAEVVAGVERRIRKKSSQGGPRNLSKKREKARNSLRMSVLLNECIRSVTLRHWCAG